jgi:hypothetical protein
MAARLRTLVTVRTARWTFRRVDLVVACISVFLNADLFSFSLCDPGRAAAPREFPDERSRLALPLCASSLLKRKGCP